MTSKTSTEIIDIRPGPTEFDILQDIKDGLRPEAGGEKTLPTMLLYDEAGLRLFEKITYVKDYYLTNAEIEVLETYADQIAERVQPGSVVVELGSGNLRKVNILLQAIERLGKDVEYYAVDLSLPELERTFAEIPTNYQHVKLKGLYGTYDHALEWLKSPKISAKPKFMLWLGSSLGNFNRADVPPFLSGFRDALQPGDTMLIGIDSCKDPKRVFQAYNDSEGVTRDFTLNGLKNANRILGTEAFKLDEWEHRGEFVEKDGYHRAFVSPLKDVVIDGVQLKKGERIRIEESWKFSTEEIEHLWSAAGLVPNTVFSTSRGDYGLHFVSKPSFFFPTNPEQYASGPVPSVADWQELWAAWDAITQNMVPKDELLSKPIKLRNAVIFYLGHIPTFLDIHLTRATDGKPTEPASYTRIFERGIDPDVENPDQCHDHSEIPEAWPPLEEVLKFQDAVRVRTRALYDSVAAHDNARVSRALWLAFEHEAMHLETLLYMLIQSERVLPPPGSVLPSFEALARKSQLAKVENQWFTIPESDIQVGLNDPDDGTATDGYFGWDNEKPSRSLHVKSFKAKARPITNGEYAEYLVQTGKSALPASWCDASDPVAQVAVKRDSVQNGVNGVNINIDGVTQGKYVRTVFGIVPLQYALDWPVVASYDELASCAQWMGGRIPTMEEARSLYSYVEHGKAQEFEKTHGNRIPAVNGHLINNGVSESPPSHHLSNGNSGAVSGPKPRDLFIDLEGTNTAFQHWHPVSVAGKGGKLCGQSDLGGAWEWTSTVLEKHDGFSAMPLYPGYTADFFDGKHNIVLGGSWATHSRVAGRKTFVNWYQRNYPYVWATARLVQDV
ncbi:uncharacterized protein N0V89_007877 [Didymosphaeria variabile]|uniref:N-methyltransferase n=1 Tax=Didymosphaeria variabile TaxID=1932322 RepID=A0A9W8XJP2_9PLEO|nr:uncharacterized protein N0V89_007877 [Didymosphaeria variabile]KAJ4352528.1 hypothetical protein N0V89_007877 [Didymosphaeria variabile]